MIDVQVKMRTLIMAVLLFLVPVLAYSMHQTMAQSYGQLSGLQVTMDEYNWTSDMKFNSITTPDLGLTFEFVITNENSQPLELGTFNIYVRVTTPSQGGTNIGSPVTIFSQTLTVSDLYLPPNKSTNEYMKVSYDYGSSPLQIGSYTTSATYTLGQGVSYLEQGTKIEPYPFNFKVASPTEMQTIISTNHAGNTYNFNVTIEVVSFGGISITIIALALVYGRRKKK